MDISRVVFLHHLSVDLIFKLVQKKHVLRTKCAFLQLNDYQERIPELHSSFQVITHVHKNTSSVGYFVRTERTHVFCGDLQYFSDYKAHGL